MPPSDTAEPMADQAPALAIRTTDGGIALRNLEAQLEGLAREAARGRLRGHWWAALVDLLSLRGEILGRMEDHERAAVLAEQFVRERPGDGLAYLARARTWATWHRFADALADLDRAEQRGMDAASLSAERATALHHLGRSDDGLALAQTAADRKPSFTTIAALAVLHAERGEVAAAEFLFEESRARYRSVSPFPLAQLDVQRGRMWLREGDRLRARIWFEAAGQQVPGYAPA
jgi:tetratricopeptide (TPR) repeat protein